MLAAIPREASVTAGVPYLSHLALREGLYSLHHILKGLTTLSRNEYQPPAPTDVVVIDAGDDATFDRAAGNFHPRMKTVTGKIIPASDMLLNDFLRTVRWLRQGRNELSILMRGAPASPAASGGPGRKLDEYHSLLAVRRLAPPAGDAALLGMDWEIRAKRPAILWAALYLRDAAGGTVPIVKGPIAPEIESGRLSEEWAIRTPPSAKPGRYQGVMLIFDPFDDPARPEQQRFKRVSFDVGEIILE
jgi:hypothetical protein